jgi:hypothetical protein
VLYCEKVIVCRHVMPVKGNGGRALGVPRLNPRR